MPTSLLHAWIVFDLGFHRAYTVTVVCTTAPLCLEDDFLVNHPLPMVPESWEDGVLQEYHLELSTLPFLFSSS